MKQIFFTPGPSELFFTVEEHIKNGLRKNIFSISHRSNEFKIIYESCVNNLKELINIPDDYHVSFLSSANNALIISFLLNDPIISLFLSITEKTLSDFKTFDAIFSILSL